jgi:hypothetical protein
MYNKINFLKSSIGLSDINNLDTLRKIKAPIEAVKIARDTITEMEELRDKRYNVWMMGSDIMIPEPSRWLGRISEPHPYETLIPDIHSLLVYVKRDEYIKKAKSHLLINNSSSKGKQVVAHAAGGVIGPVLLISRYSIVFFCLIAHARALTKIYLAFPLSIPLLKKLMQLMEVKSDNDLKLAKRCAESYGTIGLYMLYKKEPLIITNLHMNDITIGQIHKS